MVTGPTGPTGATGASITGPTGPTGVWGNNPILINATEISSNQTIATGTNGFSVGPVTVDSGITVTVSSGQRWLVV